MSYAVAGQSAQLWLKKSREQNVQFFFRVFFVFFPNPAHHSPYACCMVKRSIVVITMKPAARTKVLLFEGRLVLE